MSDWKENLKNSKAYKAGGGGMRKCEICGKDFTPKEHFHKICFDCNKKKKAGSPGHDKSKNRLPDDYLKSGYFDNNNCIREELLTNLAEDIARRFNEAYPPKLQTHQLRRFYQHVRAADNKLVMTGDWPCVNVDVKKLASFAAEAKGKNKVPDVFNEFIKKNVECVNSEHSFQKGFLEHFQAVVAYFTYYKPRD